MTKFNGFSVVLPPSFTEELCCLSSTLVFGTFIPFFAAFFYSKGRNLILYLVVIPEGKLCTLLFLKNIKLIGEICILFSAWKNVELLKLLYVSVLVILFCFSFFQFHFAGQFFA